MKSIIKAFLKHQEESMKTIHNCIFASRQLEPSRLFEKFFSGHVKICEKCKKLLLIKIGDAAVGHEAFVERYKKN